MDAILRLSTWRTVMMNHPVGQTFHPIKHFQGNQRAEQHHLLYRTNKHFNCYSYVPKLLAGILFDAYDQHTQIITELDVKLNKWHITIEKLYRKPTETLQSLKKFDPTGSNRDPKTQQARAIALQRTRWQCSKAPPYVCAFTRRHS